MLFIRIREDFYKNKVSYHNDNQKTSGKHCVRFMMGADLDSSASLVFAVASSDLFLMAERDGNGPDGGVVKVPCGLPGGLTGGPELEGLCQHSSSLVSASSVVITADKVVGSWCSEVKVVGAVNYRWHLALGHQQSQSRAASDTMVCSPDRPRTSKGNRSFTSPRRIKLSRSELGYGQ